MLSNHAILSGGESQSIHGDETGDERVTGDGDLGGVVDEILRRIGAVVEVPVAVRVVA